MLTSSASRHVAVLADVSNRQCGVVTRRQLAARGIGSDDVRAQVRAGRWQVIGRRVVVLHGGPLSATQQLWVHVLSQPPGAAVAGITASIAGGLRWMATEQTHVVLPAGLRPVTAPGLVPHLSRRFDPRSDIARTTGPPRTRVPRSVIDGALWAATDRRACGLLCAAVQQRLTTAPVLLRELELARAVARRALLRAVLHDVDGGSHSFEELNFLSLVRQAGLPDPLRQTPRRDSRGRLRFLDVGFTGFRVEIHGPLHEEATAFAADLQRQNRLLLVGERVLFFSTLTLRVAPEEVLADLRQARTIWGV